MFTYCCNSNLLCLYVSRALHCTLSATIAWLHRSWPLFVNCTVLLKNAILRMVHGLSIILLAYIKGLQVLPIQHNQISVKDNTNLIGHSISTSLQLKIYCSTRGPLQLDGTYTVYLHLHLRADYALTFH